MNYIPIKTRIMQPPKDDFYKLLDDHLAKFKDGDILCVTSKILAIHQGRCIKIEDSVDKKKLIMQEAERYMPRHKVAGHEFMLTIKEYTLIPSAGIDESNGDGYYILWPKKPEKLAREIAEYVKKKNKLKRFAVIITDSHTTPLRRGVIGISTGFFGIKPFTSYVNKPDIFGRKLKFTTTNIVDVVAVQAVFLMGEGSECVSMVIARNVPNIQFTNRDTYKHLIIKPEDDIYYPILKNFKKKKPLKK